MIAIADAVCLHKIISQPYLIETEMRMQLLQEDTLFSSRKTPSDPYDK